MVRGVVAHGLDHVRQAGIFLARPVQGVVRLVHEGCVEVDPLLGHHPGHPFLALCSGHALQLLGHGGIVHPGVLSTQVDHVVAERLVGHHADVGVRVFVGSDALGLRCAGLNVGLELAWLQQAQSLARELALHDAGHHHDRPLDLALAGQVRVRTQHHVGLPTARPSRQHGPLVGLNQLDGALLGCVLPRHGNAPELCRLARFEVLPDVAHHGCNLPLGGVPQGVALVGTQRGCLRGFFVPAVATKQVLRREKPHLGLLKRSLFLFGRVDLIGHRAAGVLATNPVAQSIHQLFVLRQPGLAGIRVNGIQVVEVVADGALAQLDGCVRVELVVGVHKRAGHLGADHVLHGLVGPLVPAHRLEVLAPGQAAGVQLRGQAVAVVLPVCPLRVRHGVAEHVRGFLLWLAGDVRFQLLAHGPGLGILAGNVLVEVLAQGSLILVGQLADLLVRSRGLGCFGQGTVERVHGMLINHELLAVQRGALTAQGGHMVVGVLVERVSQRIGPLLLAIGTLQRGHGIERGAVFLCAPGSHLLEEISRLHIGQDVRRGIAVSGTGTNVGAQRCLQISTGLERLRQALGHTGLHFHEHVWAIGHALRQPAVLVVVAAHDGQVSLHLGNVLAGSGLRQPGHARRLDGQEGIATRALQGVIAGLQPDGPHLGNGGLGRRGAQRHLKVTRARPLHGQHQGGIRLHLTQGLPQDTLGITHGGAAALVQLLGHGQVGPGLGLFGQINGGSRVGQLAGLLQRLGAGGHVVVDVPVLHPVGHMLHFFRREVGVQAAGQHLGGPGHSQHVHHGAIDQGITTNGHRQ